MKALGFFVTGLAVLMLWACSQTVSGSDDDSRSESNLPAIPGFVPVDNEAGNGGTVAGSSANGSLVSSSSNAGGINSSGDVYPDDDGDDNGGGDLGNSSSSASGMKLTQFISGGKMNCLFAETDDRWEYEINEADTTGTVALEFRDGNVLWIDSSVEQKYKSEAECKQNANMIAFLSMVFEESDEFQGDLKLNGECTGSVLKTTMLGTLENYTEQDRKNFYADICN